MFDKRIVIPWIEAVIQLVDTKSIIYPYTPVIKNRGDIKAPSAWMIHVTKWSPTRYNSKRQFIPEIEVELSSYIFVKDKGASAVGASELVDKVFWEFLKLKDSETFVNDFGCTSVTQGKSRYFVWPDNGGLTHRVMIPLTILHAARWKA